MSRCRSLIKRGINSYATPRNVTFAFAPLRSGAGIIVILFDDPTTKIKKEIISIYALFFFTSVALRIQGNDNVL